MLYNLRFVDYMDLIRSMSFLYVSLISLSLWDVYRRGYFELRPTPIIARMVDVFGLLGVYFLFSAVLPFFKIFRADLYPIVVPFLVILVWPLGWALIKFKEESFKEQKKDK